MLIPDGSLVLIIAILVMALSALSSWALVHYSLMAMPNARSAHHQPVATAGGLALVLAIGAGFLLLSARTGLADNLLLTLFGLASAAAILGYMDDAYEVQAKLKFGLIALLSIVMAFMLGPVTDIPFDTVSFKLPWLIAMAGTALWVFTLVNSVNFMDGADGAISLSGIVAALGLAILGALFGVWSVFWSAILLTAAMAGFLPFNAPKAKIFLGDTGALFIGTWFSGSALLLIREGPNEVLWLMPLLFMPYLSDVLLTMAWRLRQRQNLLQAHNDHLYQLGLKAGQPHVKIALSLSIQIAITSSLAILFRGTPTSAFLGFAATAIFALLVHWHVRHAKAAQ